MISLNPWHFFSRRGCSSRIGVALTTEVTACAAGWLRCAASCVAEFKDECAEEKGAGGPPGDDTEA